MSPRCLGILPTVAEDPAAYRTILADIAAQQTGVDLLAIVFQGTRDAVEGIKSAAEEYGRGIQEVRVLYSSTKSLARAKNMAVEALSREFDFVFIYEDDVRYPPDYNGRLLGELVHHGADIISCVERRALTPGSLLHAAFFRLTHPYPFNDRRYLISVIPFPRTVRSRYLSGGLTLIRSEVFRDFRYDPRLVKYSLGEDMDFSFRACGTYTGVLTSTVRCVHESCGIRKYDVVTVLVEKMICWTYFYMKNLRRARYIPAFAILLGSYFIEMTFHALTRMDFDLFSRWVNCLRSALQGRFASSFIEPGLSEAGS